MNDHYRSAQAIPKCRERHPEASGRTPKLVPVMQGSGFTHKSFHYQINITHTGVFSNYFHRNPYQDIKNRLNLKASNICLSL